MVFRDGTPSDAHAIAHLHAESWCLAYRGILSDHYLDQQVHADRLTGWQKRLPTTADASSSKMLLILALDSGKLLGFSCAFSEHDSSYGSYLDNLHVAPGLTGRGIGSGLLRLTMERLRDSGSKSGLYLWVLERNTRARRFYQHHGATEITPAVLIPMPDGQSLPEVRCFWPKLP